MKKTDLENFIANSKHMGIRPYNKDEENILNLMAVDKGTLTTTNLKLYCQVENTMSLAEGLHTPKGSLTKYPLNKFPYMEGLGELLFSVETNGETLNSANQFISDDETRYFLKGVMFDDGNLVSTNGRAMFIDSNLKGTTTPYFEDSFSNGGRNKLPIVKLPKFKKGVKEIKVSIYEEATIFKFDLQGLSYAVTSTNIKGVFPQYSRIIPEYKASNWKVTKDIVKYSELTKEDRSNRVIIKNGTFNDLKIESPFKEFSYCNIYFQLGYKLVGEDAYIDPIKNVLTFRNNKNRVVFLQLIEGVTE